MEAKKDNIDRFFSEGIDCSIPLQNNADNLRAWGVQSPQFSPVKEGDWTGLVEKGAAVNFRNISFNPHGHGTHTECLGHITKEIYSINQLLDRFFFKALLITVTPENREGDRVITKALLEEKIPENITVESLVVRTLPNPKSKKSCYYTGTNPPYFEVECLDLLDKMNVSHLLTDLPSVDKEDDGGVTAFHHKFWGVPNNPRKHRTITELIYVPNEAKDGEYLLNLQVAPFENDAAPSRPVLYKLED